MRFLVLLLIVLSAFGSGCTETVISEYAERNQANATDMIKLVPGYASEWKPICKDFPFCDPKAPEDSIDRPWCGLKYPTQMLYGLPKESPEEHPPKADPFGLIEEAIAWHDRDLLSRSGSREFRDLCSLLVREFRNTKRLAILEFHDTPYQRIQYGFVLLAETSRGYEAAGNMPWWREFSGAPGRVRMWRVDQVRAKQWFDNVSNSVLPSARIATMYNYGTGFVGGGALFFATPVKWGWSELRVGFEDLVLREMIRGYEPVGPAANDEEVRRILGEAPSSRPRGGTPSLFGEKEPRPCHIPTPEEYDRVRNRYAAVIAPLWEITHGQPNLKDVGGFAGAVARLRTLDCIGGYQVGVEDGEGEFYWLSKAFCRDGTQEQFGGLLADPNPTVRAMGLVCIARTASAEVAGPVLRARLKSHTPLSVMIHDHDQGFDEAQLAWALLRNVNLLHIDLPPRGAVPRTEQMAIDLEILAADGLPHLRLNAASALEFRLATKELDLSLPALEKMCPRLSRLQVLRAAGRIRPTPGTTWADRMRAFLASCLDNASLATDCRLAACSALACDPSGQVDLVIEAHKDWLMKCTDRDLLERFRQDRLAARLYGAALRANLEYDAFASGHPTLGIGFPEDLKAEDRAEGQRLSKAGAQAERALFELRHPLSPCELEHHLRGRWQCPESFFERSGGEQLAQWAFAVSARLAEYTHPWDTFSYLAGDLHQRLQGDREYAEDLRQQPPDSHRSPSSTFEEVLGESRYRTLVENVQKAVNRLAEAARE